MTTYRPIPDELMTRILRSMEKTRGKLYHRIHHPDLEHLPASHDDARISILAPYFETPGKTILDIGAHWGQFGHWLEERGYAVTAVEHSAEFAAIARGLRDACGKSFTIIEDSVFELDPVEFDVVLALNIFHHFLKTERNFESLKALLGRMTCGEMFFQTHWHGEKQMESAFTNFDSEEFARFVKEHGRFRMMTRVGSVGKRIIYRLWDQEA